MEMMVEIEVEEKRIDEVKSKNEEMKKIKREMIGMEYEIIREKMGEEEDYELKDEIVIEKNNKKLIELWKNIEYGERNVIRKERKNKR